MQASGSGRLNDSPKVLWLVKAQKAGPGVSAEEGSFLEATGAHCAPPPPTLGSALCMVARGAPSRSCRCCSWERLVQVDLVGASLGPPRLALLGGGAEELLCAEAPVCSGQPAACLDRCLLSWPRVPWGSLAARGLCPSLLVLGLVSVSWWLSDGVSQLGPSISGSDSGGEVPVCQEATGPELAGVGPGVTLAGPSSGSELGVLG